MAKLNEKVCVRFRNTVSGCIDENPYTVVKLINRTSPLVGSRLSQESLNKLVEEANNRPNHRNKLTIEID